jgi:hypothetical protein
MFAIFIIPDVGLILSVFGIVLFSGMLIEGIYKKDFTVPEYNSRYFSKIFYEIVLVSVALFTMHNEYLLYLPILLAMLYLNVNTILKSKTIQNVSYVFMMLPLLKVFTMPTQDILAYISVCVLFVMVSILSTFLFKANQELLEDAEKNTELLKEIYKMANRHPKHQVRNELGKLNILAYKNYSDDPAAFLGIISECSQNIIRYTNTDVFDNFEVINLETLCGELDKFTTNTSIIYHNSFMDCRNIISNRNFLESVLKELLENCIAKAKFNNSIGDVVLYKRENTLTILDECGKQVSDGFKRFLGVVQSQVVETIFQFKLTIHETSSGYEYKIVFENFEK